MNKPVRSVQNARKRLAGFGKLIAECKTEAGVYAKCVTSKHDVKKNACSEEFNAFKSCTERAEINFNFKKLVPDLRYMLMRRLLKE